MPDYSSMSPEDYAALVNTLKDANKIANLQALQGGYSNIGKQASQYGAMPSGITIPGAGGSFGGVGFQGRYVKPSLAANLSAAANRAMDTYAAQRQTQAGQQNAGAQGDQNLRMLQMLYANKIRQQQQNQQMPQQIDPGEMEG